ncbi:MAG: type II secretion system protein [Holophaga sp.]|nr:type II secretion system protein [Holophaga sp.]
MSHTRQKGFSLLELLVAMTILAVIGTVGFVTLKKNSTQARHLKARQSMELVSSGLDQYYLKHGYYPDFGSYEAMVEGNSPLVKENFIAVNSPSKDPWKQPVEGMSNKIDYALKCLGAPGNMEEFPAFSIESGKISDATTPNAGTTTGTPVASPATPGATK